MNSQQVLSNSLFLGICAGLLTMQHDSAMSTLFAVVVTFSAYVVLRTPISTSSSPLVLALTVLASASCIVIWFYLNRPQKIISLISLLLVLWYMLPYKYSLRSITWTKPLSIGLCWTLISIFLPMFAANNAPNVYSVFQESLPVLILITVLSLLYDNRDALYEKNDVITLREKLGKKTFLSVYTLFTTSSMLTVALVIHDKGEVWGFAAASIASMVLLFFSPQLSYHRLTWATDSIILLYIVFTFYY